MSAWKHTQYWTPALYDAYRASVPPQARQMMGRTEDCADLSLLLLVEFAAANGLTVSFHDTKGTLYCSKATGAFPATLREGVWSNKDEYYSALKRHIGARSLYTFDTEDVADSQIKPGDLMLSCTPSDAHAAIVFAVWGPGQ